MALGIINLAEEGLWQIPSPDYLSLQVLIRSNEILKSRVVNEEELKLESSMENAHLGITPEVDIKYVEKGHCIADEDYKKNLLERNPRLI